MGLSIKPKDRVGRNGYQPKMATEAQKRLLAVHARGIADVDHDDDVLDWVEMEYSVYMDELTVAQFARILRDLGGED